MGEHCSRPLANQWLAQKAQTTLKAYIKNTETAKGTLQAASAPAGGSAKGVNRMASSGG